MSFTIAFTILKPQTKAKASSLALAFKVKCKVAMGEANRLSY